MLGASTSYSWHISFGWVGTWIFIVPSWISVSKSESARRTWTVEPATWAASNAAPASVSGIISSEMISRVRAIVVKSFLQTIRGIITSWHIFSNGAAISAVIIILANILRMDCELTIVCIGWVFWSLDFPFKLDAFIECDFWLIKSLFPVETFFNGVVADFLPSTVLRRCVILFY